VPEGQKSNLEQMDLQVAAISKVSALPPKRDCRRSTKTLSYTEEKH